MLQKTLHFIKANWVKLYFILALGIFFFAYGLAVGTFKIFPHSIFDGAWSTAKLLVHQRTIIEPKGLNPIIYKDTTVTFHRFSHRIGGTCSSIVHHVASFFRKNEHIKIVSK
jgi:hypothetical protein